MVNRKNEFLKKGIEKGTVLTVVSMLLTLVSLLFAFQQRYIREDIEKLNKQNTWSAYEEWQLIYNSFEELEADKEYQSSEEYMRLNKERFRNLNKRIIQLILTQYRGKTTEELQLLLNKWVTDNRVPPYAKDEFEKVISYFQ